MGALCERRGIQGRSSWCAELAGLARSLSHTHQKNQIDEMNQRDSSNQLPATRREIVDCQTPPRFLFDRPWSEALVFWRKGEGNDACLLGHDRQRRMGKEGGSHV